MPDDAAPEFDPSKSIGTVRFEYDMAVHTATLVQPMLGSSSNTDEFVIAIALIESFLLHARALNEFLQSRENRRRTDVTASDFVPGFSHTPLSPELLASINREVQHITVFRQVRGMSWVPMDSLPPIVECVGQFIKQLAQRDDSLAERLSLVHQRAIQALAA